MSNIIIIGSSTGGPLLLNEIFSEFPVLNAAIVVVQHIPPMFDKCMADRLNSLSLMDVGLAEHGNKIETGKVYVAPSRVHLKLVNNDNIMLYKGGKINCCCPSIDVAMKSIMKNATGKIIGVILTGMGSDGAEGITHIKKLGGITIAQDEKTSAIYGMPKAAYETGNIDIILPKEKIARKLRELVGIKFS